jgi:hypothetical protein
VNDPDESDLLDRLSPLSAIFPEAEDTQRVLRSARRTFVRRNIMRWTVAGVMAASIAIAVILVATNPRSTSAAELLARSAEASSQFKGWVHIRESSPGEKDFSVEHVNNETGAWASESHVNGGLDVEMYVPAEKEEIRYSSSDGKVKISEISQDFANGWKTIAQNYPLSMDSVLAQVPGATVRQSDDGGLIRFDVAFPVDDPQKAREQNRSVYPSGVVMWADPTSKLIMKGRYTVEGKSLTMECSYGDPVIHDIFDVGVPKDSKIVDLRPPLELSALMQRLRTRFNGGFGDFAAVSTEVSVASVNGTQNASTKEIEIYGASGAAFTAETFSMDADFDLEALGNAASSVHRSASAARPAMQLDAVLEKLKGRTPIPFLVSDGKDVWQDYTAASDGIHFAKSPVDAVQNLPALREMNTLPGQLWPVRDLYVLGADTKSQIITDPTRPGQIGVKVDSLYFMHAPDDTRLAQMYWFDPARDDLPVDGTDIYTSIATDKVVQENHVANLAFAQTQNGKWYPSQWIWKVTTYSPQGMSENSTEGHLQVWTDKKLGNEWFVDPATKAIGRP